MEAIGLAWFERVKWNNKQNFCISWQLDIAGWLLVAWLPTWFATTLELTCSFWAKHVKRIKSTDISPAHGAPWAFTFHHSLTSQSHTYCYTTIYLFKCFSTYTKRCAFHKNNSLLHFIESKFLFTFSISLATCTFLGSWPLTLGH